MTWFLAARAFLARIPWQVWAALALCLIWYWERDQHADAREATVRAEYEAKARKLYEARARELAAASERYEALAQSIRASERTDRETIREIYRNVQVPASCAVPASAVSVLDNAIRDANAAATGQPSGPVSDAP